ncbi:MAG TPA: preprotein translocase subunit YajC [Gemmatimonadaceae bacterium]|jgi:preprotein translocase subunit YajC|nr:preprotein translocase subunit YajC [Gemmatimonadaceae bacterium]
MTLAYATLALLQVSGGSQFLGPVFMYGAIFAIFYFVLIRPQSKQRKEHEELIRSVKKGDEVVTAGGLIGEVIHIKETSKVDGTSTPSLEDRITIKSADSRMVIERGKIARIVTHEVPDKTEG